MKKHLFSITKKDFIVEWFSGTGAGGQYGNKHQNCVRLKHHESGVIVTGQSNRERKSNLREAFRNLQSNPEFKIWFTRKCFEEMTGRTIKQRVDSMLDSCNLKIEVRGDDDKWTQANI